MCHFGTYSFIDLLTGQKITIFYNTSQLLAHFIIFFVFQLLIKIDSLKKDHPLFDAVRCFGDSVSKSRLISSSAKLSKADDHVFFLRTIVFVLLSTQLNKYLFERFLVNSRDMNVNSFYKNLAMAMCILLYSSEIISEKLLYTDEIIYATSLILFIGNRMDHWNGCKSTTVQKRQQGHSKLRLNEKTRSVLS